MYLREKIQFLRSPYIIIDDINFINVMALRDILSNVLVFYEYVRTSTTLCIVGEEAKRFFNSL